MFKSDVSAAVAVAVIDAKAPAHPPPQTSSLQRSKSLSVGNCATGSVGCGSLGSVQ